MEKLKIARINDAAQAFTVMMNPAEMNFGVEVDHREQASADARVAQDGPGIVGNPSLSFALVIDATGVVPSDAGQSQPAPVEEQIQSLLAVVYRTSDDADKAVAYPVLLRWGTQRFDGRIASMSVDYTLFQPDGTPLRARVQLSFTGCASDARDETVGALAPPAQAGKSDVPAAQDGAQADDDTLDLKIQVSSDGAVIDDSLVLRSAEIRHAVNAVPSAVLEFIDGDLVAGTFPASDAELFKPGATIKVEAGYGDGALDTLFEGIVVKHGVRLVGANEASLVVECRDKSVRMTVGRRNANHLAQTDDAIIGALIEAAGLQADVEPTTVTHTELAQHYCSDWDFVLARAEANGLLVIVGDKVRVKPPEITGAAVLTLAYGRDLIEFDAEIDARTQFAAAQAVAWDPKTQAPLLGAEAAPAALNKQGDLGAAELAQVIGLPTMRLQSGAPLAREALTAWAKALQLKAGLARVQGRMRILGDAAAKPGVLVELEGMGARFSGTVYLSSVRHEIADGEWTTDAGFGLSPNWFVERSDVRAPAAAGLLPGVEGLQVGTVLKLDGDPDGEHRIQVAVPVLQAEKAGVWARLLQFHASDGIGAFFAPEVGDEVVLGYFGNDPSHPVALGSLYSSKRAPPYALAAANDTKAIVTRCKSKIEFDEAGKVITITTPGANRIVLSDADKSILLQDQNGNKVTLGPSGIALESPKDIQLSAKGRIVLDAVGAVDVGSKADVKVAGLNVECEAQVGFTGKGTTAELSAAAQTVVKGATVLIN